MRQVQEMTYFTNLPKEEFEKRKIEDLYSKRWDIKVAYKTLKTQLELIKIADIINGQYLLINDLQDTGVNLNTLKTAEDMKNAAHTISKDTVSKNIGGTRKTTNDYGTVKFDPVSYTHL